MASCEVNGNGEQLMPRTRRPKSKTCIKCKNASGALLVRGLAYCKSCLQSLVVRKFKNGVDEIIRPADSAEAVLAVGLSGGLGSTVLLHLIAESLVPRAQRTRRHRWDKIHVLHVYDKSPSNRLNSGDSLAHIEAIVAQHTNMQLTAIPLEDSFAEEEKEEDAALALDAFLTGMPTQTGAKDGTHLLVRRLLERTAHSLGATHLLLGRTMSSLSMTLLSSICSGRGFSIADERHATTGGITSFNPLQDLGSKECGAYAWWNQLQVASSPILRQSSSGVNAEIPELTRAFITGLERDFPSTVSTIVKTCGKVVPKGEPDATCRLCARSMQIQDSETPRALIAITARKKPETTQDLCYSCQTMMTSANSKSSSTAGINHPFPVWASGDGAGD